MSFFDKQTGFISEGNTDGRYSEPKKKREKKEVSDIVAWISLGYVIISTVSLLFLSLHFLSETENAVITRFGNPRLVSKSGPCFIIPLVDHFQKVDMTVRGMAVGYTLEGDETIASEATMITKDFNFLDIFFYLEYQVSDPIKFLYSSRNPEIILSNLFQSTIRDTIGSYNTDEVLTTSRYEIQDAVTSSLSSKLEALDIGIVVTNATIQDVEFPTQQVAIAFDSVETAKTDADSMISAANTYYTETTEKAKGNADKLIQDAEAAKTERVNEAEGQVARFESMYEQYLLAPEVTKLRMYYEAMEEILPDVKVIITNSKGEIVNVFTEPYANS